MTTNRVQTPYVIRSLNGLAGDPAVLLTPKSKGDAMLFDCGCLGSLSHREMMKVQHVFVSHTHMDHFQDFDRLVRVHLPHRRVIRVFGPVGIADQLSCKLRAYTWNLIDDDQLHFEIYEWDPERQRRSFFRVQQATQLQAILQESEQIDGELCPFASLADGTQVSALALQHKGISSLVYLVEAPATSKVLVSVVKELGLKPGSWIKQLQSRLKQGDLGGSIQVNEQEWLRSELAEHVLQSLPRFRFLYVTDIGFEEANLNRLFLSVSSVSHVLSECSFLRKDRDRAARKAHLTGYHAALIAARLQAERLDLFHVSNLYHGRESDVVEEAFQAFGQLRELPDKVIQEKVKEELETMSLLYG